MKTREAIQEMDTRATRQGYQITQGVVYGNYSNRKENGVKVQSVSRTYKMEIYELVNPAHCMECGKFAKWQVGDCYYCDNDLPSRKLTLLFDASTDEIY